MAPPFFKSTYLLACCLLPLLSACASLDPANRDDRVSFNNPPAVGTWLKSQRELVACDTQEAAQFMSNFGFFHPQCQQLIDIGEREFQVIKRKQVELAEGKIWLLDVKQTVQNTNSGSTIESEQLFYVPIPWHDWL